jgi:hypothetical protein
MQESSLLRKFELMKSAQADDEVNVDGERKLRRLLWNVHQSPNNSTVQWGGFFLTIGPYGTPVIHMQWLCMIFVYAEGLNHSFAGLLRC